MMLAVLLGAFVYRWAADLAGRSAGLLALFLYVLDPNIVAHAQVITTDMGVTLFGFVAFYCYFKYQTSKSKFQRWWVIGAGLALGAALATKVSAGLLVPLLALIVVATGRDTWKQRVARTAVLEFIALGVVWAMYGFEVGRVPGLPVPMPAATHIKIYQSLQQHYAEGHPSFLMGVNSTHGWWYYFPAAFLIKTPLPTLILLAVSVASGVLGWILTRRKMQDAAYRLQAAGVVWILGLFPVVHFVTALFSSVNIGYRHLLPILPFLFVFIAYCLSRIAYRALPVAYHSPGRLVALSLFAWYVVGAVTIFPHNLAYFNELAGGPDNGYKWLVDSNLDWGQNLKELKMWLDARGVERVFISQFSPSRPEVYGLLATMLPPSPRAGPFAPFDPAPGWYAIGATTLQGVYTPDVNTFAYFRAMTPTARIGHAMFVYYVPETPAGQWIAQCANPTPPLEFEDIQAGFGRGVPRSARLIEFDCSTSWWYHAENAPGWYVDGTARRLDLQNWYPSARLIYQPRSERARFTGMYRVDSASLPAGRLMQARAAPGDWPPALAISQGVQVTAPVTTTGPVRFEGFWLRSQPPLKRGEQIVAFTAWRVIQPAAHPLSIMAHLLDAQGHVVSGCDGLGVPIEVWQSDDLIVQAHWLDVPQGLARGTYWIETGVYRLDTLERYFVSQGEQAVGNRLVLAQLCVE